MSASRRRYRRPSFASVGHRCTLSSCNPDLASSSSRRILGHDVRRSVGRAADDRRQLAAGRPARPERARLDSRGSPAPAVGVLPTGVRAVLPTTQTRNELSALEARGRRVVASPTLRGFGPRQVAAAAGVARAANAVVGVENGNDRDATGPNRALRLKLRRNRLTPAV